MRSPTERTVGSPVTVLTYAPYSFNGNGPAQTCAAILGAWASPTVTTALHAGRFRRRPKGVVLRPGVAGAGSLVPWRLVEERALRRLDDQFAAALDRVDPGRTVAYFWPDPPLALVERAQARGVLCVREMINTALATSGPLLDDAYARLGLAPTHGIGPERIASESDALRRYDAVFAPNPEVEASLRRLGLDQARILPTSFGWSPERLAGEPEERDRSVVRFLFVGSVNVRKGVPELLEAWARADLGAGAELVLVGRVAPEVAGRVAQAEALGNVRAVGFQDRVGDAFRSADVFVFPTLEEGGPQVTYEAAGCGLPVITTPMGAARLVETGRSGVVAEPGSVDQLASALVDLAADPGRRRSFGAEARRRAADFTYARVGPRRLEQLRVLLDARQR
ncbi:glycosyltransferase family 4 protein [Microlunatus flavus]|uniref:Glycosyltransferase involved in cell wall bisynthesis n=1 Tax=Microlunatus flavus TaxID=1036181 RepID=A0A1H9DGD7_9ACTN|nr:glycosyltransferase family 4 protein [Microlunatus flavus]SEQ12377.1 Glycosyltransferase involved in cell wall bisynthesis [Microlunatus flavus]